MSHLKLSPVKQFSYDDPAYTEERMTPMQGSWGSIRAYNDTSRTIYNDYHESTLERSDHTNNCTVVESTNSLPKYEVEEIWILPGDTTIQDRSISFDRMQRNINTVRGAEFAVFKGCFA